MLNPMEAMKTNADAREEDGLDAFEDGIRDVLRHLPSEQGRPSPETDAAILRTAVEKMAQVRRRSLIKRVMFGISAAAACLALALFMARQAVPSAEPLPKTASGEDSAAIILREISSLFPGQIRAIERDESGLQLSLADTPTANSGPAVVLEIRNNGDSREIITFSGQTITIMGHSVTIHTSHDGRIILKGPDIEWMSGKANSTLPNLRIIARLI